MGLIEFVFGLGIFMVLLVILGYIFWIIMFIDALKRRDILWIVLLAVSFFTGFLPGIIAVLYYFLAYKTKGF